MTSGKPVVIRQLPEIVDVENSRVFLQDVQSDLEMDRPCLVFDFSQVRYLDSAGIDLLLRCMEETMKRNGDLKLAAVSPELTAMLELTRVDRLFEIFGNCDDAVESFQRFSGTALQPRAF